MMFLKNKSDIKDIKKSCEIASCILNVLYQSVESGVTTEYVNKVADELCKSYKVLPAFLGYKGFEYSICISINDEVVHGLPSNRIIQNDDIISVDFGVIYNGWYSDTAFTKCLSEKTSDIMLVETCRQCLYNGINKVKVGSKVGDVSNIIYKTALSSNFSIIEELVGHGVGKSLHEEPQIPNFGPKGEGFSFKQGMILAIEPIIAEGNSSTYTLQNGWTIVTSDRKNSSHFEHTVVVLSDGVEILTYPK